MSRKEARSKILRLNYSVYVDVRHGRKYREVSGVRFVPVVRMGSVNDG